MSEEKYQRLIENLRDNYFFYSHNTEGIFTYISSSITSILGYSPQEFLTHYSEYMTDNPINNEVVLHTELSIKGIKQPPYEVEVFHKDGSRRILRVQEIPVLDKKNRVTAVEGIAENITHIKQMQEMILESEKLKALGVITSGISHEFNNILAIIKGFSLLLLEKYKDHREVNDKLNIIIKSANDGARIVGRMQEFTRREPDREGYAPVDMRVLLRQVIGVLKPRWKNIAQAKGITYHLNKKGLKKVPLVYGNSTELQEVLLNILNNSLDAMPQSGDLTFRTWSEEATVCLSISDCGTGMAKEIQKKIFDPFFSTKMPKGTGLGMSVSYGIIQRHEGNIEVESEVGKGTKVTIRLPAIKNTLKLDIDPKSELEHEIEPKNLRILVVDDDQLMCNILNEFLSQAGQNVTSVCRGKEAIIRLQNESFDLLLCDLVMPDVGGREVIKALDTLDKRPKVGLITGWSEKIGTPQEKELKIDFFVKKPFDLSVLSKHINRLFSTS
ncbi:MAG: ATP-binding protein [Candidatus Scalindua sp.]|nr:ATP-binding protein [Candidatus Scalindua sp.]